eukprot:TRINITY_DN2799_c0_g1_i1.p1 TRINITY_DN2799_c0_g1~~TRINITY_DN2799_c0_g1_i1.p1  ORF type:complete len:209 (-),score=34.71 TRINITY_DN2799_c0_g1_i1:185-772(-)
MFLKELFLFGLMIIGNVTSQSCCPTKQVAGSDAFAGTYNLYNGNTAFLPICMDQCAYKKVGNSDADELFCFKTQGATHDVECEGTATTGSAGTCPFTKDNVSWGEYQTKIPMPSGMSSPYTVIMKFDAVTTIGSCHSNCNHAVAGNKPQCTGNTCTVTYTGSDPLQMFNIKKDSPAGDTDRSNMVSVTINGAEQC